MDLVADDLGLAPLVGIFPPGKVFAVEQRGEPFLDGENKEGKKEGAGREGDQSGKFHWERIGEERFRCKGE